jgi:MFS transporter, DHA1 family, inner membrane transport protein
MNQSRYNDRVIPPEAVAGNAVDINGARAITAMVGLGVVAAFATVVMPIMVGAMVDHLGLSARNAGLVAAAEMSGVFGATLAVVLVVHRWNRRRLALVGLSLLCVANLVAATADTFAVLVGTRFAAGLGAGLVMVTVQASMAATRDPVRAFGILGMSMLLAGVVGLPGMPLAVKPWGTTGAYLVLASLVLPGLLLLRWLPAYAAIEARSPSQRTRLDIPWVVVGLAALLCYMMSFGAVGPYMERLGVASGLDVATVGKVLGAGSIGGMVGAALATWLGTRAGRAWPLFLGIFCSIGSLWLLVNGMQPATYTAAAVVLMLAAMFTGPYVMGSLAALDRQGRVLVTGLMMQAVGLAAGPALAGLLVTGDNYVRVGWFGIAGYGAGFALFLPLLLRIDARFGKHRLSEPRLH